jgi:hypothetical protein
VARKRAPSAGFTDFEAVARVGAAFEVGVALCDPPGVTTAPPMRTAVAMTN